MRLHFGGCCSSLFFSPCPPIRITYKCMISVRFSFESERKKSSLIATDLTRANAEGTGLLFSGELFANSAIDIYWASFYRLDWSILDLHSHFI